MKKQKQKKKLGIHHRIHRHLKKHLRKHLARMRKLKKKRPRAHKVMMVMSVTIPLLLGLVLFGSGSLYLFESYQDELTEAQEQKITVDLPNAPDDTANWKSYTDSVSGFSVKFPEQWAEPKIDSGNGEKYNRRIVFTNGLEASSELYKGFEVYIYDSGVYSSLPKTANLMPKKESYRKEKCDQKEFFEAIVGEEDYPAQEVEVGGADSCFEEAYFFSVRRGDYLYNIAPLVNYQGDNPFEKGKKTELIMGFPKFFEILSTFVIPEKEKPKPSAPKEPKVAPKPATQPKRALVHKASCAHKNDHPRKSKTKKHRHMDEDCCMDPDEWPNPRCQY